MVRQFPRERPLAPTFRAGLPPWQSLHAEHQKAPSLPRQPAMVDDRHMTQGVAPGEQEVHQGRQDGCGGHAGHRHLEDDERIPVFAKMADASHKHGCPIFMQLFHAGPQAFLEEGQQTISSSSLTDDEVSELTASMPPRALTVAEIADLVDKFAVTGSARSKSRV